MLFLSVSRGLEISRNTGAKALFCKLKITPFPEVFRGDFPLSESLSSPLLRSMIFAQKKPQNPIPEPAYPRQKAPFSGHFSKSAENIGDLALKSAIILSKIHSSRNKIRDVRLLLPELPAKQPQNIIFKN